MRMRVLVGWTMGCGWAGVCSNPVSAGTRRESKGALARTRSSVTLTVYTVYTKVRVGALAPAPLRKCLSHRWRATLGPPPRPF